MNEQGSASLAGHDNGTPRSDRLAPEPRAIGQAIVLNAERDYLACLLRLDAARVRALTKLVEPEDLSSLPLAELLTAVQELAALDTDPEPGAVLAWLRAHGRANGEAKTRAVTLLLADLYACAAVPASVRYYAAAVMAETIRRRTREAGERIVQAAERVPVGDLLGLVVNETSALMELVKRAEARAEQ